MTPLLPFTSLGEFPETPEYSKMVAGFLGAKAPKQREKDREGRGEGKKKLL